MRTADVPEIVSLMGKNVDDMTRDEAIEAVKLLGQLYSDELRHVRETRDWYRDLMKRDR